MSAIKKKKKREVRLDTSLNKEKENDAKEQIIEGKNKTYVISKTLGKGTFGKVKMAYNINNKNEKYACKILLKSNIKDEDDNIRCKREMEILKRMHHVNVVRTYEIISTDTTYFIFMDYCGKGELFNYIVEQQHLSEEKSAFFYYQIINGVEYIHNKGVCHRDLKPENLLLTEKMKLKIIDFGLSNFYSGNLLETPCGSPCYASPEMVMGKKYNGFFIDVWSSGIILYAMLCGYLPFEEMENDEYNEVLFKNIVECNVDFPKEFITPTAKDLLMKILVRDPKKRITIEEIKQHNFYLLGELMYKQTFENNGGLNEYDLFFLDKNDFLEKELFYKDEKENKVLQKENKEKEKNKEKNQTKDDSLIYKNNKNGKDINNEKQCIEENKEIIEIKLKKNDNKNDNKDYLNKNNKGSKENKDIKDNNKYMSIREEIINNSEKIKDNKKRPTVETAQNQEMNLIQIRQTIPNIKDNNKENNNINNIKENNLIISTDNKNQSKRSVKKSKDSISKNREEEHKQSSKQLSSPNYITTQLLTSENQKLYDNTMLKLLNLKTEQNQSEEGQKPFNNLNKKKNNKFNFNTQYLNTEIYPISTKTFKYKNKKDINQLKLLNKNVLNENKITFNNILNSLKNQNKNFKSKTPNRYTVKKKVDVKKNHILSNSITKAKNKYNAHSPGMKNFEKINNNIHINIENNYNFPRQNDIPLTTHGNSKNKNSYYLINSNILKFFNSNQLFQRNNNSNKNKFVKSNKKLSDKTNIKGNKNENKYGINSGIINKDWNSYVNENYIKTINSGKISKEKDLIKKSVAKALNLRSFEYCLSSTTSKKQHPIIDTKIINSNANYFNQNTFNKNKKNEFSKKSFGNLKPENSKKKPKQILIHSNHSHSRTNTEIINNKINSVKNRINLSMNKNYKLNSKIKTNEFHKLFTNKLNYMNVNNNKNKDNDNNIIINFNILKPNIFFDQQKSSKKKINNKINNNFCSTLRNNTNTYAGNSKRNNYGSGGTNQMKNKEINNIIRSIHDTQKFHGNFYNNSNNIKRLNTEVLKDK